MNEIALPIPLKHARGFWYAVLINESQGKQVRNHVYGRTREECERKWLELKKQSRNG